MQSGTSGLNGTLYFSRPETDSAPRVLPWNAPVAETKRVRPVLIRAIFKPPSTASAPLLQKKQYCRSPGVISASFFARPEVLALSNTRDENAIFSSCSLTTATTRGCEYPTLMVP